MRSVLLDTGPFVALLDARDPAHVACRAALEEIHGSLLTTEAVLTETLHLLGNLRAQEAACAFILRGAATLVPTDLAALEAILGLMRKYADVPMDYADATLVHLAGETQTRAVFTLDRRGFLAYRYDGRKAFTLVPVPSGK